MATTRDQLVAMVAGRFGFYRAGVVDSATKSVISDADKLNESDNFWQNHYCRIVNGGAAGQERRIKSSSQANASITTVDFSTAPANGDQFEILPLPSDEVVRAIEEAIRQAGSSWCRIVDDTTTIATVEEQEHDLPADLSILLAAYVGDGYTWNPFTQFEVTGAPGAYKLLMRDTRYWYPYQSTPQGIGPMLRLVYGALPSMPSSGPSSMGVPDTMERELVSFVQEYALGIIHEAAMARNKTGESARADMSLSRSHFERAAVIRRDRTVMAETLTRTRTRRLPRHI